AQALGKRVRRNEGDEEHRARGRNQYDSGRDWHSNLRLENPRFFFLACQKRVDAERASASRRDVQKSKAESDRDFTHVFDWEDAPTRQVGDEVGARHFAAGNERSQGSE